jgi:hypothetical protein
MPLFFDLVLLCLFVCLFVCFLYFVFLGGLIFVSIYLIFLYFVSFLKNYFVDNIIFLK